MKVTIEEAHQYARMTFKQWGCENLTLKIKSGINSYLGLAAADIDQIFMCKDALKSFELFDEVLKHEIAHCLDYKRNGGKWRKKNGRHVWHDKVFKDICRELGVRARTKIPC